MAPRQASFHECCGVCPTEREREGEREQERNTTISTMFLGTKSTYENAAKEKKEQYIWC
jgi:hypothetical protein